MASLKKKIILSFAASLAIFLVFVSAIIFSGLNMALRGWYRASESRYAESTVKILENLYSGNRSPGAEDMAKALEGNLSDRFSLLVISPGGTPLFAYNLKRPPFPPPGQHAPEWQMPFSNDFPPGMGMNRRMPEGMSGRMMRPDMMKDVMESLYTVYHDGSPVAYVWVRSSRFETADNINRDLLNSVVITLMLGITSAFAVAILSTFIISGKMTGEATKVSAGLEKLASGNRDVHFPESSLSEIASISKSASILQERLIREEEAEKQWTQDIAHDLRTPTAAIKAQLEAMADGVLKPDSKRIGKLLEELGRLENLIEDINRLTKIESPQSRLQIDTIPAQDLADIILERFSIQAAEKGLKIEITNTLDSVKCDTALLTRAVSNLVQNSISYSPRGSVISVSISREDGMAEITVENEGSIPGEETERIFARLYRGEFARYSGGTGLGLTIAKAAVEKHGGTIKAENIIRDGKKLVRFTVRLPF